MHVKINVVVFISKPNFKEDALHVHTVIFVTAILIVGLIQCKVTFKYNGFKRISARSVHTR